MISHKICLRERRAGFRPPTEGTSIMSSGSTCSTSAQPMLALDLLGFILRRADPQGDVGRQMVAAQRKHRGMDDRAIREDGDVRGASADVDQAYA